MLMALIATSFGSLQDSLPHQSLGWLGGEGNGYKTPVGSPFQVYPFEMFKS
jgi:hypothetical protein